DARAPARLGSSRYERSGRRNPTTAPATAAGDAPARLGSGDLGGERSGRGDPGRMAGIARRRPGPVRPGRLRQEPSGRRLGRAHRRYRPARGRGGPGRPAGAGRPPRPAGRRSGGRRREPVPPDQPDPVRRRGPALGIARAACVVGDGPAGPSLASERHPHRGDRGARRRRLRRHAAPLLRQPEHHPGR
uniref:Transcriptional regulator, AcrR family n=1 Tax=Parastrongyloides trichosuri TaxID=131310 RepID=A0A0N5A0L8_PARTI